MELAQETELIQGLQSMITLYMEKNPSLTLNSLASRSAVPVTTLRRLMSGQQKNEIAPHSVLNLVSYVLREKNLSALLTRVDASIADFLRKHFGNFIFASSTRVYDLDLNTELRDETKYLIYKLAANHNGTDLMTIVENFGSQGKRKAEELQSKGLLVKTDDRLHAKEKNFSLDLRVAAEHLPALVSFYKPESIADGLNTFFSMSESLTSEAIAEIKQLQRDCVKSISAIMNDSSKFGSIPYFTINLAETMLSESINGDLQ
jgi:hypothetical protein